MYIQAGDFQVRINHQGYIESMCCMQKDYLLGGMKIPLIRVTKDTQVFVPDQLKQERNNIFLVFESIDVTVEIQLKVYKRYMTLEVVEIVGNSIDALIWGPYATTIKETIGEVVGVVRDQEVAIGMQALNIKTVAGWPKEIKAEFDESEGSILSSVSVCGFKYSDLIAAPIKSGSIIQAYCRDRSKAVRREVWGKEAVWVEPLDNEDARIIGSKIALFGSKEQEALDIIEQIEIGEDLPHPTIDGEWVKRSRKAMKSYLITDFSQENIEGVITYAKKAGFQYIYHPDPFIKWGHFQLREDHFPDGEEGLKKCIDQAKKEGIGVGIHTLTTFTTTNDEYITPIPNQHLAKIVTTQITDSIDQEEEYIEIKSPQNFEEVDSLGAVLIEQEIIQYEDIEEREGRYYLTECKRGAFGTTPSIHKVGSNISKLFDYPYKVLFPDIELQEQYIKRIIEFINRLDIRQVSFDGLEGCLATGHEAYSTQRMINQCYKGWDHEVINDASRLEHYNWHIHTRTNWGEPWGATMREGQIDLREGNQPFYHRNLFPRMIGWFLFRLTDRKFEATTLDEVEWMLAKAAGYDAGFSICIDEKVLKNHGYIDKYLEVIKDWEEMRELNILSKEQREKLSRRDTSWHLERAGENEWMLQPVKISSSYICDSEYLQPGQPGGADWGYTNLFDTQPLHFRLKAKSVWKDCNGSIENPGFRVDNKFYKFKCILQAGQYLLYKGGLEAIICDENFNEIEKVAMIKKEPIMIIQGENAISFTCDFKGKEKPEVDVKFIVYGNKEKIGL